MSITTDQDMCSICLDPFKIGKAWMVTDCGHKFHIICIQKYPKKECPNCRQIMLAPTDDGFPDSDPEQRVLNPDELLNSIAPSGNVFSEATFGDPITDDIGVSNIPINWEPIVSLAETPIVVNYPPIDHYRINRNNNRVNYDDLIKNTHFNY